ncbi:MAG: hypothetical protein ACJA0E_001096 [Bermanella sp.]|jgi:hypothetical protein
MSDSTLPSHSAAVLFEDLPVVTQPQLDGLLLQHFSTAKIVSSNKNSYVVKVADMEISMLYLDEPYPQAELKSVLPLNYTLQNGDEIVSKQDAHIIISVLTPAANQVQAIGQAITLTHLIAVISQLAKIQAVLWINSGSLQNSEMFNGTLQTLGKAIDSQRKGEPAGVLLPLIFWTPVRIYSPDQGAKTFGARSSGLNAFVGVELDLLPQSITAQESAEQILNLVTYQFQSGAKFKAGDSMEIAGSQFQIKESDQPDILSVVVG